MPSGLVTDMRRRLADGLDVVLRRRDPLVPPRRLRYVAQGDYVEVGDAWLGLMRSLALVRPDERVLEIGCGAGLLTRPLARHLGPGARYVGVDDDAAALQWCEAAYRDRTDFRFTHVDDLAQADLVLPFEDAKFDIVILHEAFPRLTPDGVTARLVEARRVLTEGGRLFATAYLLDQIARAAIADGSAAIAFEPQAGSPAAPVTHDGEQLIAVDEEWLLDRVAESGFKTAGIRHGSWAPREGTAAFPDIIVARL